MCKEKIEYFYPVKDDKLVFTYHGNFDDNQNCEMNLKFNYGLYRINTENTNKKYKVSLLIEENNGGRLVTVYGNDGTSTKGKELYFNSEINFDSNKKGYGNAYFYLNTGSFKLKKDCDYKATLKLIDEHDNVLDTNYCYFDVED